MKHKCKCGKDAVVLTPDGKNACVRCYKIYTKKEKSYGTKTHT